MVMSWGSGWSCFPFPPNLLPVLAPRLPVSLTFYIHKSEFEICVLMSSAVRRRADGPLGIYLFFFFLLKEGKIFVVICSTGPSRKHQPGRALTPASHDTHHMTAQPIRGQAEEPGRHSNKLRPHQPIAALQFWIMTDPFSNYENTKRGFASLFPNKQLKHWDWPEWKNVLVNPEDVDNKSFIYILKK